MNCQCEENLVENASGFSLRCVQNLFYIRALELVILSASNMIRIPPPITKIHSFLLGLIIAITAIVHKYHTCNGMPGFQDFSEQILRC